jgi:type II secretory pathway pseudopilin PulG
LWEEKTMEKCRGSHLVRFTLIELLVVIAILDCLR